MSTTATAQEKDGALLERHIAALRLEWKKKEPSPETSLVFSFACKGAKDGNAQVSTPAGAGEKVVDWCERHVRAMRDLVQSNVPDTGSDPVVPSPMPNEPRFSPRRSSLDVD